jgi:hypothetical protein
VKRGRRRRISTAASASVAKYKIVAFEEPLHCDLSFGESRAIKGAKRCQSWTLLKTAMISSLSLDHLATLSSTDWTSPQHVCLLLLLQAHNVGIGNMAWKRKRGEWEQTKTETEDIVMARGPISQRKREKECFWSSWKNTSAIASLRF